MQINKSYPCDNRNYRKGRRDSIQYIVIHYVGASGSALDNVKYYGGSSVGASAHYFVGHESENGMVYQSVDPANCAWHCGCDPGGSYYHVCRNDSAIGIEMCCHKTAGGIWYFDSITVDKTVELTKWLMTQYGVPVQNVLRHYDVTHKICPAPFVNDAAAWMEFKRRLAEEELTVAQYEELKQEIMELRQIISKQQPFIYNYIDGNMHDWAVPTVSKLVQRGIIKGDGEGLGLNDSMLKLLVWNDRAGLYD